MLFAQAGFPVAVAERRADAVAGDGGADVDGGRVVAGADPGPQIAAPLDLADLSDIGDDAGEHADDPLLMSPR